jgi:hypothetical protein
MTYEPRACAEPRRNRRVRRMVVAATAVAGISLALVSCGGDEDSFEKTPDGFNIEPAAEVGPNAFTPSVVTGEQENALGVTDGGELAQGASTVACDTDKFVKELQARPDAHREWAKVLGLRPDDVPAYVKGLRSTVLTSDTKVTNHGLKDGKAYPRQSVLTAGTAVLVDASPGDGPAASTTSSSAPAPTAPGAGTIVTRCKCGNPLLPPGDPSESEEPPATEAPGTDPSVPGSAPGSAAPGSTRPGTTRPATTATGATTSSTGRATTTSR